jgi:hypothetical protein
LWRRWSNVYIEDFYPYSYTPIPRYGHGKPWHLQIERILAKGAVRYGELLDRFTPFTDELLKIGMDANPSSPHRPHWNNGFFPGLDAVAIYGMTAIYKPRTFIEIGSGNSTKFAAAAKTAHSPDTKIISIDPAPRAEINDICDTVVRQPLQDCDQQLFGTLEAGDFLFLDGSHRVLQNSDVSVFFLEILPMLKPGVVVHIHDIFWPDDYPAAYMKRMYSEQYMLGVMLLFAESSIDVMLPNAYISSQRHLVSRFDDIWNAEHLKGIEPWGGSFWFSKK